MGFLPTLAIVIFVLARPQSDGLSPSSDTPPPPDDGQYASDITVMDGVKPLLPFRSTATPFEPFKTQPGPIGEQELEPVFDDPLEPLMRPIRNTELWTRDNLGITWNIYYTLLYQSATRTVIDPNTNSTFGRSSGTGRLDLGLNWSIFDEPFLGHGQIGLLMRSGVIIGQPKTYQTAQAVGSVPISPNALGWGNDTSLCLAYWQQGVFDDRVVFTAGKIHPNQYIALSRLANDESKQFVSGVFDGLNTLGTSLGNYAPGLSLQVVPVEQMYINTVVIDAEGSPNTGFQTVGNGSWWAAGQVGFVPEFKTESGEILKGNWALMFAATNYGIVQSGQNLAAPNPGGVQALPPISFNPLLLGANLKTSNDQNGYGYGIMLEQDLPNEFRVMAEYGHSNSNLSPVEQAINVVFNLTSPFGRKSDLVGIGFNWSKPTSEYRSTHREETFMELFYRLQLTDSMQLTPDLQIVLTPATGDPDPIVLFGLRLRTQF